MNLINPQPDVIRQDGKKTKAWRVGGENHPSEVPGEAATL